MSPQTLISSRPYSSILHSLIHTSQHPNDHIRVATIFITMKDDDDDDDDDNNNDVAWDDICVNPHENDLQQGREQGRVAGLQAGYNEGLALGRRTAIEYGMEVGFVRGVVQALMMSHQNHGTTTTTSTTTSTADSGGASATRSRIKSERIAHDLHALQRALDDFSSSIDDILRETNVKTASAAAAAAANADAATAMRTTHSYDDGAEKINVEDDSERPINSLDVREKLLRIRACFKLLTVHLGIPHFSLEQIMNEAKPTSNSSVDESEKPTTEW